MSGAGAPRTVATRRARWPGVLAAGLRALPSDARPRAAAAIARAASPWLRRRRGVALENLARAFPDLGAEARAEIWRDSLRHQAQSLLELAQLAGPPAARAALVDRVDMVGGHHLDHARSLAPEGRGLVVVTAHVGNWELCLAAMAAAGHRMTVVHHGLGRPGLSAWLADVRTRQGDVELVELGRGRAGELMRAIRSGRHLVAMMDQNARLREGRFAPFFGALACTRRGPVILARRLGVPLLPVFSHRVGAGPAHRVELGAPLRLDAPDLEMGESAHDAAASTARRSSDARVDAALVRVNRVIEDAIRAHPAQWIWSHRRYRTRPPPDGGRVEAT